MKHFLIFISLLSFTLVGCKQDVPHDQLCKVAGKFIPPKATDIQQLGCSEDDDYAFAYFTLDRQRYLIANDTGTNTIVFTLVGPMEKPKSVDTTTHSDTSTSFP